MPDQILDAIKWCSIISCFGVWIIVLVKWGYNFLFEDENKIRRMENKNE
jgi:hypothetical protein